jgi:hypothetical protein
LYRYVAGGGHPFGERYERDTNVLKGNPNLRAISHLPEATVGLYKLTHSLKALGFNPWNL